MALLKCPECNKKISETAASCPKCGKVFGNNELLEIKNKRKKINKRIGIIFTILMLIMLPLIINSGNKKPDTVIVKQYVGMGITPDEFSHRYNKAVDKYKAGKNFKIQKITKEDDHVDFLLNSHSIARAYITPGKKTINDIDFLTNTSRSVKGSSSECIILFIGACAPSLTAIEAQVHTAELMQVVFENNQATDKPNIKKINGLVFSSVNKPSESEIKIYVKNEAD